MESTRADRRDILSAKSQNDGEEKRAERQALEMEEVVPPASSTSGFAEADVDQKRVKWRW